MKRIYMVMAMIGLGLTVAKAQNVSLSGAVRFANNICVTPGIGQEFSTDTTSSLLGLQGVYINPGEGVITGDKIYFLDPGNEYAGDNANIWLWTASQDVEADQFFNVTACREVDSIKYLMNISKFENNENGWLVSRANLVTGQSYGYFIWAYGVGSSVDDASNSNTEADSIAYLPIKWGGCDVSVNDMKKAAVEKVTVFPNPATDNISFEIMAVTNNNVTAKVTDLTGRTLVTKDFGRISVGNLSKLNMNVGDLPAGMYVIEINYDNNRAVSKFNIAK
jgi:hypothetical protein